MNRKCYAAVLVCSIALCASAAALEPPYRLSPDIKVDTARLETFVCPSVPKPFTSRLQFTSKYVSSDIEKDRVDPVRLSRYRLEIERITRFEQGVVNLSDQFVETRDPLVRLCAWTWLVSWAKAGALEQRKTNGNGRAVRKWALASAASATLKLELAGGQDTAATVVHRWLEGLARQVVTDYSDRADDQINNHDYWAAWAVLLVGVVVDDSSFFDWGVGRFKFAMARVDKEGYLSTELNRGSQALRYHNFAVQPLIMIAEAGANNGIDLYGYRGGALHRLVRRIVAGVKEPEPFAVRAGTSNIEPLREPYALAWLVPYTYRFGKSRTIDPDLLGPSPMRTTRLGGDLSLLSRVQKRDQNPGSR